MMSDKPMGALLQINRFCNLGCSHCSISAPRIRPESNLTELTFAEWEKILIRLRNIGITQVRFTGGEPFLRRDLEQLCKRAVELDLSVSFVTNGLLIFPTNIKWVEELQPKIIWVSIYGYPSDIYESISGSKGTFQHLIDTIESLINRGLNIGLYYSVGDSNFQRIGDFIRHFYKLGIRLIKIVQISEHGRAAEKGRLKPFPEDALGGILDRIIESTTDCSGLSMKVSMKSRQSEAFRRRGFEIPKNRSCQMSLHNLWTVDSKGAVSPCCLYLNKGRLELFNATSDVEFKTWQKWDLASTLNRVGVNGNNMSDCPALEESVDSVVRPQNDFVCPLIYAQINR
jgi:MoaA/NifB/PqqE/SkfB family radical SAM enzyme